VIQIGDCLEAKIAAFEAHTTQAPVFPLVRDTILARGREERFHLAATSEPTTLAPETDLFAGVNTQE
jgi:LmbE family N-acetylglucosaminyl deacetylase